MTSRSRRQQNDSYEDAAAPDINSDVLRILVTSVTTAMTTVIVNATFLVTDIPNTTTYSSAILPTQQQIVQDKDEGREISVAAHHQDLRRVKNYGIYATLEHANNIMDLFKYRYVHFGLENIMHIPTSGIREVDAAP